MKTINALHSAIILSFAATSAGAAPPTQVGDSFLFLTGNLGDSEEVIYLAPNGTCELLSAPAWGATTLLPGTYAYSLEPGSPYEATLRLNIPGAYVGQMVLPFVNDTSGGGPEGFGFMLSSANAFLANVSNRVTLRPGDAPITGFVIAGSSPRIVLIRAVGPSLANFNVSPVSRNPAFEVFSGSGSVVGSGQAWPLVTYMPDSPLTGLPVVQYDAKAMGWIFRLAGAFPLNANSTDQVFFGVLGPGAYTVLAEDSTVGAGGGAALIEVYILPYSG
jgi:hypothetical protein